MIGFVLAPLPSLFSVQRDVVILGLDNLETSFGTIRIKPFCTFSTNHHDINYLEGKNFRTGRAEHDISILGNILENPGFSFEYDDIAIMNFSQILDIQGQLIDADRAFSSYNENGEVIRVVIIFHANPTEKITLSDGMQIEPQRQGQSLFFSVNDTNTWTLGIEEMFRHRSYFLVTRSEWDEPRKFVEITFEENWGKFIDGVPYEGR